MLFLNNFQKYYLKKKIENSFNFEIDYIEKSKFKRILNKI